VSGAIPLGFYTNNTAITFTESNLLAANIKSGVSVFGVTGNYTSGINLSSNVYRDQATTNISQVAETTTYAGALLPAGYRDVPVIAKDDDGYVSPGVSSPQVTLANRVGFVNCGTTQSTIAARIADCATQNGSSATWDGTVKGNAGQGVWKLAVRFGAGLEVWQDQRTGLLWSSLLASDNWCRASGNAESGDPSGYCNSVTYQPNYPTAQSWCAEDGPTAMMPVSTSGENWATGSYSGAKGGLGKNSSPGVRWRLPTRYDYQLADTNGIRFVMPEMAAAGGGYEWSASVYAASRYNAWIFVGANGVVSSSPRANTYAVRCVGR
jgi:hypothetical protein